MLSDWTPRTRHALCPTLVVALAVLMAVASAATHPALLPRANAVPSGRQQGHVTWIDSQAPGLFDPATPALQSLHVRYRVDAKVLLPLGFTSLELWSRPDVGWVTASYRDRPAAAGARLRGYELFSASRPERARGLNRLGFFREALHLAGGGVDWTAYFGAMSFSPEKSYGEAARAVESRQPQLYEVTDGFATPQRARASVFRVGTETAGDTASHLYVAIRPQLLQPRRSPSADGTTARPLPSLAFLGALQASLRAAVSGAASPSDSKPVRVAFVHNGGVRQLELTSMKRDASKARRFAGSTFVRDNNAVFRLDYRVMSARGNDGTFRLWAELPTRPNAPDVPIAPLAWEFQPRSFLRLYVERIE